VAIAIEAGMHEAERIGELHAVMVIPRPLDDLADSLPQMELEEEQPLRLPINLEAKQEEAVAEPLALEATVTEELAQPLSLELERELADEEP
jgi:carbon dioxide concentrating mechanism protein CcmO